jgi:chromosome partitioning protein
VKVLATYSIKGGVGKTTSAVNLAFEAARTGARVLLWDLDPQGAATFFLRVRPALDGGAERMVGPSGRLAAQRRSSDFASIDVVPADFSLRHLDLDLDDLKHPRRRLAALLEPLENEYDVAFLDCAPSISLASESVFGASDALLVPTIPTPLSARTLQQLHDFLETWSHPPAVLPFVSMLDRRKKLQRTVAADMAAQWPGMLRTAIPNSSVVERMGTERAPVGAFAGSAAASVAFRSLWEEIASSLWA